MDRAQVDPDGLKRLTPSDQQQEAEDGHAPKDLAQQRIGRRVGFGPFQPVAGRALGSDCGGLRLLTATATAYWFAGPGFAGFCHIDRFQKTGEGREKGTYGGSG